MRKTKKNDEHNVDYLVTYISHKQEVKMTLFNSRSAAEHFQDWLNDAGYYNEIIIDKKAKVDGQYIN